MPVVRLGLVILLLLPTLAQSETIELDNGDRAACDVTLILVLETGLQAEGGLLLTSIGIDF